MGNDLSAITGTAQQLARLMLFAPLFMKDVPQYSECPEDLRKEFRSMAAHINLKEPQPGLALLQPIAEKYETLWRMIQKVPQWEVFDPTQIIDSSEGSAFIDVIRDYWQRPKVERDDERIREQAKKQLKAAFLRARIFEKDFNHDRFYEDAEQAAREVMVAAGAFSVAVVVAIEDALESGFEPANMWALILRQKEAEHYWGLSASIAARCAILQKHQSTEDLIHAFTEAFLNLRPG